MANAALSGASPAALKKSLGMEHQETASEVSPSVSILAWVSRLEKLQKRREQISREHWPVEKQVVHLPASSGAPPAIELEDP